MAKLDNEVIREKIKSRIEEVEHLRDIAMQKVLSRENELKILRKQKKCKHPDWDMGGYIYTNYRCKKCNFSFMED